MSISLARQRHVHAVFVFGRVLVNDGVALVVETPTNQPAEDMIGVVRICNARLSVEIRKR